MILSVRHIFFTFVIITMFTGGVSGLILDFFIRGVLNFFFPKNLGITRVRSMNETEGLNGVVVLNFIGMVEQYKLGYTAEEHTVTTKDGYILKIHRITESPRWNKAKKGVVFLQHGLICSSESWVMLGPGKDLAFLLADRGYDVWLGNIRGNSYGRSHVNLTVYDRKFWEFSFHEMGMRDLPAMLDYVLKHTGEKTMQYVGHSMGNTMLYILLSMQPEYNAKLKLFTSFSPVAYWTQTSISIKLIMSVTPLVSVFLAYYDIYDFAAQCASLITLSRTFCNEQIITQPLCLLFVFTIVGFDPPQLNRTALPYMMSHAPAGASMKTMSHYHQNIFQRQFQSYDYGILGNLERYKSITPIRYNVGKITAPGALYYGQNDNINKELSVMTLKRRLPNVVLTEKVPYKLFNHIDFTWATDGKTLLYNRAIKLIEKYNTKQNSEEEESCLLFC